MPAYAYNQSVPLRRQRKDTFADGLRPKIFSPLSTQYMTYKIITPAKAAQTLVEPSSIHWKSLQLSLLRWSYERLECYSLLSSTLIPTSFTQGGGTSCAFHGKTSHPKRSSVAKNLQ